MIPDLEILVIFFWAIPRLDISECRWEIVSGIPRIWLSTRWNGEGWFDKWDVLIAVPIPRLILYLPETIYYQYGEEVKGDPYYFIPF